MTLTIYSRPGCHLCDEMKGVVARAIRNAGADARIEEIDISRDPMLEEIYGLEIPVLLIAGKKVAKYRVSEADVTRMLRARSAGSCGSSEPGG